MHCHFFAVGTAINAWLIEQSYIQSNELDAYKLRMYIQHILTLHDLQSINQVYGT
jgi:hypothetical protein